MIEYVIVSASAALLIGSYRLLREAERVERPVLPKLGDKLPAPGNINDFVKMLKRKYWINSIIVMSRSGEMLLCDAASAELEPMLPLFTAAANTLPNARAMLLKRDSWYMIFALGTNVYALKAPGEISTCEMKALAREINDGLEKFT